MLKNLFQIPDTFEPDDRRRRQIINAMLMILVMGVMITDLIVLIYECNCTPLLAQNIDMHILLWGGVALIIFIVLFFMNRSTFVPSWLSGAILVLVLFGLFTQADTPAELYNGRSTVIWAIPILMGAIIFQPRNTFLIAFTVFGIMQVFTPPDGQGNNSVNYFSMMSLLVIAFGCWLGMTIANNAIRDARHEAANLEAIYKGVADGILVLNQQGRFVSANPALLAMIPRDELDQIIVEPLGETLEWKHKVFSVHASPVPEVGTVAVIRDETRRHEIERARDALIATASHELRTPLAAIMNYLELMAMLVRLDRIKASEFDEHLSRALENSRRLQQLVNNILDQAQIQAGVLVLKEQPFDLRALLERTRQLLDVLIQQKQLTCDIDITPAVPAKIRGDADRLYQVLVNLMGNAIKFTDHGGITINVSMPAQERLAIEVIDTGAGIPPEQLPDIFEAFRRGSNYAQRERQGAGLGLSIAKEIVAHMGGELFAVSEPGIGSTFTVTLPIEGAQP